MSKRWALALAGALVGVSVGACGAPGSPGAAAGDATSGGGGAAYKVGLVYSRTGPLATYGAQYLAGFNAGLDYATKGTDKVNGHPITVTESDDAGDPAKAVSAATDLIGKGTKVIAGSTSSGVALQVAPLAADNKVLFISGPAATDAITGANKYTFRSGRETWQDIMTAGTMIGDVKGKKVTVLAQDSAFGKAGATVTPVAVPAAATDFTPFASTIKSQKPDLLFVAWAGANATQMWQTLSQQGVFDATKVVTGLDVKPSFAAFGPVADKISFLSHFFDGATATPAYQALDAGLKKQGQTVDLFTNDGFVAAQMVVRALGQGGDDVDKMVSALEGWSFQGPKGDLTIRAQDHAVLQPMFTARLVKDGAGWKPQLVSTVPADKVAPPVAAK